MNNPHFCYEWDSSTNNDNEKNDTFYSKKKNIKIPKKLTDGSKSMRRNVDFAGVFTDITRKGALPEEATIPTAKMTEVKVSLKVIHKWKDKTCVIYTDHWNSMQSTENNKENSLILKRSQCAKYLHT